MPAVRKARQVLALAGLVLVAAVPADAEWQFAPFVGRTFKGTTTLLELEPGSGETHWNFGGTVTLIGESPFGVEGYVLYTPGFFQSSESPCNITTCTSASRTYALMGNVVLATPRRWNRYGLRPFVSGGIGLLHASRDVPPPDPLPVDVNLVGMNVGGGAVGFVTDRVGLRFDLRYFRKIHGPDEAELEQPVSIGPIQLRYWTAAVGVVFRY
jgi:hypothetical protein